MKARRAGPGCRACWIAVQLLCLCVGLGVCSGVGQGLADEEAGNPKAAWVGWEEVSNVVGKVLQVRNGQEKHVWPALAMRDPRLVAALVLGAVGACLSSAGGVGGGGLYVPLFALLVGFDAKTATALSNVMILGGSVSNLGMNLGRPHPELDGRPLIDFDAALLLQPNMLLGISLGVIANVMLPGWMIIALLASSLGYMTSRSVRGAMRRWANESLLKQGAGLLESVQSGCNKDSESGDLHTPLLVSTQPSAALGERAEDHGLHCTAAAVARDRPLHKLWPVKKLGMLALVWFVFFAIQAVRGSSSGQSLFNVKPCGLGYWLLTASLLPVSLGFTSWTAAIQARDKASDEGFVGDQLVQRGGFLVPVMAFLAGLLGGMLGIGGGMIVNPLFLEMGMLPQVTAATCSFMVFFSSSLSVAQYWMLGRIPVEHALVFAAISFVFSAVGQILVQRVIVRYGRASIIVFSVSAVMGLSALTMAGFGTYDVVQQYLLGEYMGFHRPC